MVEITCSSLYMDLIQRELSIIVLHANMIILHVDIKLKLEVNRNMMPQTREQILKKISRLVLFNSIFLKIIAKDYTSNFCQTSIRRQKYNLVVVVFYRVFFPDCSVFLLILLLIVSLEIVSLTWIRHHYRSRASDLDL